MEVVGIGIGIGCSLMNLNHEVKNSEQLPGGVLKVTIIRGPPPVVKAVAFTLSFGLSKFFDRTTETILYFYNDYNLGSDKDLAAEHAEEQGNKLDANGNSKEASEWYNAGYHLASGSTKQRLKDKIDNAQADEYYQKGKQLLSQEQYIEAKSCFLDAINACSESYGNLKELRNKLKIAEGYIYNEKGDEYYYNEEYEEAAKMYEKATMKHANELFQNNLDCANAEIYYEKGSKYLSKNQYCKAKDFFSKAVELQAGNLSKATKKLNIAQGFIYNKQANKLYHSGHYEEAIKLYEKAYSKCGKEEFRNNRDIAAVENYYQQAEQKLFKNNFKRAHTFLNKALQICSDDQRKVELENKINEVESEIFNEQGNNLYNDGKYIEAVEFYDKAIDKYAKKAFINNKTDAQAEIYFNEGETKFLLGDFENAEIYFSKAVELSSEDYGRQHLFEDRLNLTKSEILNEEGNQHWNNKRFLEASRFYEKAYSIYQKEPFKISSKNSKAEYFYHQGKHCMSNNNFEKAAERFSEAYETCIDNYERKILFKEQLAVAESEFFYEQGNIFWNNGNYGDARKMYEKAYNISNIQLHADSVVNSHAEYYNQQGEHNLSNGKFDKARTCFTKAFKICTKNYHRQSYFKNQINIAQSEIFAEEGNIYWNNQDYEKAKTMYEKAYDISDKQLLKDNAKNAEAEFHYQLGERCFSNGHFIQAKMYFKKAYNACAESYGRQNLFNDQFNNSKSEILNKNGERMWKEGKYLEAKVSFEKAISVCSDDYEQKNIFKSNLDNVFAEYFYQKANKLWNSSKYENAKKWYKAALKLSSDENKKRLYAIDMKNAISEAADIKGNCYLEQNNLSKAIYWFNKACEACSDVYERKQLFEFNRDETILKLKILEQNSDIQREEDKTDKENVTNCEPNDDESDLNACVEINLSKLNEESLALLAEGELLKQKNQIELAICKYEDAALKLFKICKVEPTENIFNSLTSVINAFIKCEAYNEAHLYISIAHTFFPQKDDELDTLRDQMKDQVWYPDYIQNECETDEKILLSMTDP